MTLLTVNTVLSEMAVMLFYVRVNGDLEHGERNKVISTRHAHLVNVQFWVFQYFRSFMILRERLTGVSLLCSHKKLSLQRESEINKFMRKH